MKQQTDITIHQTLSGNHLTLPLHNNAAGGSNCLLLLQVYFLSVLHTPHIILTLRDCKSIRLGV